MVKMPPGYIYLLKPLSSVINNENIYKIGKTHRHNFKRFCEYPTGSILLLQSSCLNCDTMEKHLLNIFNANFTRSNGHGREYFEGDVFTMKKYINDEITNEVEDEDEVADDVTVEVADDVTIDVSDTILKNDKGTVTITGFKNMNCINCNYNCHQKCDWIKHINTKKHLHRSENNNSNGINIYKCKCGKEYKHLCSLCKHRKLCNFKLKENLEFNNTNGGINNVLINLLRTNLEIQQQLLKMNIIHP